MLTFLPDVHWAVGFTGSNGLLIVRRDSAHFLTDRRYEVQAHQEVRGAEVHVPGYELIEHAAKESLLGTSGTVLFQSDHVSVAHLEKLKAAFPDVIWLPAAAFLTGAVAQKDPSEIEQMKAAQHITEAVFEHLLGLIRPGITEREVAAEIVYQHLRGGAERVSFDPIVAAGPNGALPHLRPTIRTIQAGDMVVIDMGCYVDGYASDMTRTLAVSEPGAEARRVYQIVRDAQQRALDSARAGLTTKHLDAAARDVIEQAGYGEAFSHSLGHGIGLQVHEWPRVSYLTEDVLPENAAVTIEPGIYLPDKFGVRIEDVIVLRAEGHENLTGAPKDLIVL